MNAPVAEIVCASPLELAKASERLNLLERGMAQFPAVEMPLIHRFTPGMYIREIFIPANTLATTKIHRFEHPFVVTKGKVRTWTEQEGVQEFNAPYVGITKPGTRRVVFAVEDVSWVTFHRTDRTDLKEIEAEIIEPHDIPTQVTPDHLEATLRCTP